MPIAMARARWTRVKNGEVLFPLEGGTPSLPGS